jgi:hypothetical protein
MNNEEDNFEETEPEEDGLNEQEELDEDIFGSNFSAEDRVETKGVLDSDDKYILSVRKTAGDPLDAESLIKYDEAEMISRSFFDEYGTELIAEDDEEMARAKELFVDFLVAPSIAGSSKGNESEFYFPSENLIDRNQNIEIVDNFIPDGPHQTTVSFLKNQAGEIQSIEVLCKCGEKTVINIELED